MKHPGQSLNNKIASLGLAQPTRPVPVGDKPVAALHALVAFIGKIALEGNITTLKVEAERVTSLGAAILIMTLHVLFSLHGGVDGTGDGDEARRR